MDKKSVLFFKEKTKPQQGSYFFCEEILQSKVLPLTLWELSGFPQSMMCGHVFHDAALKGLHCAENKSFCTLPGQAWADGGGKRPPQEADAGVAVPETATGVQAERRGRGGGGRWGCGHHDDHAEAGGREKGPGELSGTMMIWRAEETWLPCDVVDDHIEYWQSIGSTQRERRSESGSLMLQGGNVALLPLWMSCNVHLQHASVIALPCWAAESWLAEMMDGWMSGVRAARQDVCPKPNICYF